MCHYLLLLTSIGAFLTYCIYPLLDPFFNYSKYQIECIRLIDLLVYSAPCFTCLTLNILGHEKVAVDDIRGHFHLKEASFSHKPQPKTRVLEPSKAGTGDWAVNGSRQVN